MKEKVLLKQPIGQRLFTNSVYMLFDPTPDNIKHLDLIKENESLEKIEYAKLSMPTDSATMVDLTVFNGPFYSDKHQEPVDIKTINRIEFGELTKPDDLADLKIIDESERKRVWNALVDQKILNNDGSLSPEYKVGMKFNNYSDCPIYENAVMSLIEKNYVAEIILRQLLVKEQDPVQRMKWIAYLPVDPYQDMLCDLQAAHIISGTKVTEESVNLKDEVDKVPEWQDERDLILKVLKDHQAEYVSIKTPDVSLVTCTVTNGYSCRGCHQQRKGYKRTR